MNLLQRLLRWALGMGPYGSLTEDEIEEYEYLGECMDWRVLSAEEKARYEQLHAKRQEG